MIKPAMMVFLSILLASCSNPTSNEIKKMRATEIFSDSPVAELVLAAEAGDTQRINQLAHDGVDVNAKGLYNVTPILRSLQAGNKEGYTALLKLGADPNVLDRDGFAAMNRASEEEDSFWLREALAHGGNPNLENTGNRFFPGQTPMFFAISKSRAENVRLLIAAGADVNHKSKNSCRPLDEAMSRSDEIVFVLVEAGAEYRYGKTDLVDSMNTSLRNGLFNRDEMQKRWFHKTIELLEKKGTRFERPEK